MQTLSANFLSFVLLLVLGFSPVQNTIASVSHTKTMASVMQQEMNTSSDSADKMQKGHCAGHTASQCKCDISHCTNVSFMMVPTSNLSSFSFINNNFSLSSDSDFIQPLVSTLFRPPRV